MISQIGTAVYGTSAVGHVLYYSLQAGTMLILVMAANTGFADFPRLASFQAGDSFLPRQLHQARPPPRVLERRSSCWPAPRSLLVIVTGAEVTALIPLYAIGVFTGFTLSQAGMTKHHLRLREPGWRKGIAINGFGAFLSARGRGDHRRHQVHRRRVGDPRPAPGDGGRCCCGSTASTRQEAAELDHDVPAAIKAPILRRHVVLVFVDRLDMATARAIQYARTLTPDDLRVVHFAVDDQVADELADEWRRLGLLRVPLELVDCPDRRLTRAAVRARRPRGSPTARPRSACSCPTARYRGLWHRAAARPHRRGVPRRPRPGSPTPTSPPSRSSSMAPSPDPAAELLLIQATIEPHEAAPERPPPAPSPRSVRPHEDRGCPLARPRRGARDGAVVAGRLPARLAVSGARHHRRDRGPLRDLPGPPPDRGHRRRYRDRGLRGHRRPPEPARHAEPDLRDPRPVGLRARPPEEVETGGRAHDRSAPSPGDTVGVVRSAVPSSLPGSSPGAASGIRVTLRDRSHGV